MTRLSPFLGLTLALAFCVPSWALPTHEAGPGVAANAPVPALRWRTFAPPGGRFSVLMPSASASRTFAFKDGNIGHVFISAGSDNRYVVQYRDESRTLIHDLGSDEVLTLEQDGYLRRRPGSALRRHHMTIGAYPCEEAVVALPRHRQETHRVCLAANRIYDITVVSPASDPEAQADADKFLNSFTPTPAAPPKPAR